MYYDAHCHYSYLKKKYENFIIAAVSMDYSTSIETLSLKSTDILAGIGIHPWKVHEENLNKVLGLTKKADFIGEVGLDYRYAKADKSVQLKYFEAFAEEASNQKKLINVHALDAWEDAFNILQKHNVKRAIFHWYTGPENLLKEIEGSGYFITVNPSVTFQKKHQNIVIKASLDIILTESDGGYEYKGRLLEPVHITEAIKEISKLKGISEEEVNKVVERNFRKAFE
ncbi:TatD family deoxyribonuclease [Sulfolobus sp. S-194]|uniref:TatD family hydrolase n=1 Tax=Sulfolobus sp. S-194 TaxID=2512240 RepID=UPI001437333B|nr:TatD family hydrolase [Sulfolobus sp. S-194]QIW24069.1 TatD family deoxyribonuclease [Sulfolobus sp. S-194]